MMELVFYICMIILYVALALSMMYVLMGQSAHKRKCAMIMRDCTDALLLVEKSLTTDLEALRSIDDMLTYLADSSQSQEAKQDQMYTKISQLELQLHDVQYVADQLHTEMLKQSADLKN